MADLDLYKKKTASVPTPTPSPFRESTPFMGKRDMSEEYFQGRAYDPSPEPNVNTKRSYQGDSAEEAVKKTYRKDD